MKSEIELIRNMFIQNDAASIQNQVLDIIFRDCFYRTHNEGLRYEFKHGKYSPSYFIEHFHDDYFLSQAVRLRKILEDNNDRKQKKTFSLLTALICIRRYANLLTLEEFLNLPIPGAESLKPPQWAIDATRVERLSKFKCLSGEADPKPSTTMKPDLLDSVEKLLTTKRNRLQYHLNKYWLHSSDPSTRVSQEQEPPILTLNYLQNLMITSVWAAKMLSRFVDVPVLSEMPVLTYDPLVGTDIVFSQGTLKKARTYFEKREQFYRRTFAKYDDHSKFFVSPTKYIEVDQP